MLEDPEAQRADEGAALNGDRVTGRKPNDLPASYGETIARFGRMRCGQPAAE
jgi:hypothetical protein